MIPLVLSHAGVIQVAPDQEYSGRAGQFDVSPPRIESPSICIDAHLDEPDLGQLSYLFRL